MTMPHESGGEELLEYETEQDETPGPVMPIDPLPVHVCEPVITIPTVAQHLTTLTRVLTAAQPVVQILAQDPLRVRAQIMLKGANDVVICHSLIQAQDPSNADVTLANPNGAILSSGLTAPVEIATTQPVWVAAAVFPARVAVLIERRTT